MTGIKESLLGTERNLRYFVDLKPDSYRLFLKVKDTKTDLIWKSYTSLTVLSVTDKGFFCSWGKRRWHGGYGYDFYGKRYDCVEESVGREWIA